MTRSFRAAMLAVAALLLVPASSMAADVAVLGNNQTDEVLTAAGHSVTLVTDAQVATPGFLDGFDAFVFTRPQGAFNATLSAGAASEVRAFTRRAVLLNGDFADAVGTDDEVRDLMVSSVRWAAERGGGYIGELEGATAGLSENADSQPALNFVGGTAAAVRFGGADGSIEATSVGVSHPVLDGVSLPHDPANVEFGAEITGAPSSKVLARYSATGNPAILAGEVSHVAVLGNNQTDEQLDEEPGIVASVVTDAQVAGAGFLDGFDVFFFTRPQGAFNATLSDEAAARVRAFTRRAVLLNGDFADAVATDGEVRDLFVSSVRWAGARGGGYVGELEGATAGLSANADSQPALNFVGGTAGAVRFGAGDGDIVATPAGESHPVLDGVALPHDPANVEFGADITGAPAAKVLARYSPSDNPAILATEVSHVAVLGNNQTDEELNEEPGIVASVVTDAQVAGAGFLDGFDSFVFTRPQGTFNATLSDEAAARVRAFTRRAVLLNGDFADAVATDGEVRDLIVSSVRWAGARGGGYVGELEGAAAGLSSNGDSQPALNFVAGAAGAVRFGAGTGDIVATPAGESHPVLDGVALPHGPANVEFGADVTGAPDSKVLARYSPSGNPAILATELTRVAVLGNNQTDEQLNGEPGIVASVVTDAQVAREGFLDGFDVFFFTRPQGAFNATLSDAAAERVRAFTRRAVLLNADFADAVAADGEVRDLFVSSVRWAAARGGGYIGELEAAGAGLTANGDGQPVLGFIPGTATPVAFGGGDGTITATSFGASHPVLDGVALPRDPANVEFGSAITGAPGPKVLARYPNGNPAILATEIVLDLRRMVTNTTTAGTTYASIVECNAETANAKARPFQLQWSAGGVQRFVVRGYRDVRCFDDGDVAGAPNGFDTQTGEADGTLNGAPGFRITWRLVDGGATANDRITARIVRLSDGAVIRSIAGTPSGGTGHTASAAAP